MFSLTIPKNKYEKIFMLDLLKDNFFLDLTFSAIEREILPGIGLMFAHNNNLIGSITIDTLNQTTAAFRLVVIKNDLRKQGLGKVMLDLAEDICLQKGLTLVYIRSTLNALQFYQKAGFIETVNNEFNIVPDTIFMSKNLNAVHFT